MQVLKGLLDVPAGPAAREFHSSIRVNNLAASVRFYAWLLGTWPKDWTHRYATFIRQDLKLNFVLRVSDGKELHHDTLYHLGIEVADRAAVVDAFRRAREFGAHVEKPADEQPVFLAAWRAQQRDTHQEIGIAMKSKEAVEALSALAHEHRLGVYRLLVEAGHDGLNAGTIAARLKLPPSSLTFHLQHLHRAGLVTQQRNSRQLIYAADFSAMNELVGYLTENCCAGSAEDCSAECAPTRDSKKVAKKPSKAA